ncbi:MAG: hypothetical protein U1A78_37045 [Polyangia bacterium]
MALGVGLALSAAAGCATVRPTRQECEQYIQRVGEILGGTHGELQAAGDNDESRRALDRLVEGCMNNQTKSAVVCAVNAKSQEAYDKCGIRAQTR